MIKCRGTTSRRPATDMCDRRGEDMPSRLRYAVRWSLDRKKKKRKKKRKDTTTLPKESTFSNLSHVRMRLSMSLSSTPLTVARKQVGHYSFWPVTAITGYLSHLRWPVCIAAQSVGSAQSRQALLFEKVQYISPDQGWAQQIRVYSASIITR